jgi:alkylhydroperoxidase family enzyme
VIADPRAVAARWPDERARALAELAMVVTETPWTLSRARLASLNDDDVVHAVALASYFGHLNRIADAVAVPLDYNVHLVPPHAEPATPPYLPAPRPLLGKPVLQLAQRPATATAIAAWREYMATPRGRIGRRERAMIARRVGLLVGAVSEPVVDGPASRHPAAGSLSGIGVDHAILALADVVTLAPWQLGDTSFAALRAGGFDDAAIFDVCAVASSAGVFARIDVALTALAH